MIPHERASGGGTTQQHDGTEEGIADALVDVAGEDVEEVGVEVVELDEAAALGEVAVEGLEQRGD